jgi:protease IV
MKKGGRKKSSTSKKIRWMRWISITLIILIVLMIISTFFTSKNIGNVALIKVNGVITGNGGSSYLTGSTLSSQEIVAFIEDAENSPWVEAIVIEINSPGGSAVASDEIASALKKTTKPTVAVIREVGASGGYWVASATDHVVANRMSITGSIGVISSYLEFSGLMEKYGVNYQRLVAGENKDIGSPFRALTENEEEILQEKLDIIHDYFIQAIAENRALSETEVEQLATGEFFLGIEAQQLNLVDELGDMGTAKSYLQETYGLEKITYQSYAHELTLMELLQSVFTDFSLHLGEGLGNSFVQESNSLEILA